MTSQTMIIDEYISKLDKDKQIFLQNLRQIIAKAVSPQAEEIFSYQMPGFRFYGRFVWYMAYPDYCGLYIIPGAMDSFADQDTLCIYRKSKSTIRLSRDQPLPEVFITQIVQQATEYNLAKANQKIKK